MSELDKLFDGLKTPKFKDGSSFDTTQQKEVRDMFKGFTETIKTAFSNYDEINETARREAILSSDSGFATLKKDAEEIINDEDNADWLNQVVKGTGGKTIKSQLEKGIKTGDKTLLSELVDKEDVSSFASRKRIADEEVDKDKKSKAKDSKTLAELQKKPLQDLSDEEFAEKAKLEMELGKS